MDEEALLERLLAFEDVLTLSTPVSWMFRQIGWALIKGLAVMMDAMQGLTNSMTDMLGFFNAPGVQNFLVTLRPYLVILLALALAWLAFQLMMNRKVQTHQVVLNVLIAILVIGGLAPTMTHFETFTKAANDFISTDGDGMMSDAVIKENLTDVSLYDQHNWEVTDLAAEGEDTNNIQESRVRYINMVDVITEDTEITPGEDVSEDGQTMLTHKIVQDAMGETYVVEIDNGGLFSMFSYDEHYYRFEYNFWTIFITLFVGAATLLFATYKVARLCYEIAFNKVLASILAFADVQNGQMLKAVLKNIVNMFAIVIMIFLSLRLYNIFMTYLPTTDMNAVSRLIAMIAVSAAVVDGPKICERIFGIDAGLKSGWGMVAGGYALGRSAKGIGKTAAGLVTKGASGGVVAAAGAIGAAAGLGKGNPPSDGKGGAGGGPGGPPPPPPGGGGSGVAGNVQQGMKQAKGEQQPGGKATEGQPALHAQMKDQQQANGKPGTHEGKATPTGMTGDSGSPSSSLHSDMKENQAATEGTQQQGSQGVNASQSGNAPIHSAMGRSSSATPKPSLHGDMGKGAQAAGDVAKAGIRSQTAPATAAIGAAGAVTRTAGQMTPTSPQPSTARPSGPSTAKQNAPVHRQTAPAASAAPIHGPAMPEPSSSAPVGGAGSPGVSEPSGTSQPVRSSAPTPGAFDTPSGSDYVPQPSDIPYQTPNAPMTQGPEPMDTGSPAPQQPGPQQPAPSQHVENRTLGQYFGQKSREKVQGTKTYQRAKRSYDLSSNTTSNWKQTRINAKQLEAKRRQQQKQNKRA